MILSKLQPTGKIFSKDVRLIFNSVGYNSSLNQSETELQIITAPIAYQYWAECKKQCALQSIGFHGWIDKEDENAVIVTIYYNAPPLGQKIKLSGTLIHGKVAGAPAGKPFNVGEFIGPGGSQTVTIERVAGQALLTATLSGQGYPGVVISSNWEPSAFLSPVGHATLTISTPKEQYIKDITVSALTPNDSDVDAIQGQLTSPDGKWHASLTVLTINAEPGTELRNLQAPVFIGPYSDPNSVLYTHTENYGMSDDHTSAFATIRSWTVPTAWAFKCKEIKIVSLPDPSLPPIALYRQKTFTFFVPSSATGARLDFTIDNNVSALAARAIFSRWKVKVCGYYYSTRWHNLYLPSALK